MKKRIDQVNQLLQEEVGKIILREIETSKDAMITVTRADTSSDLRHAAVYVSVLFKDKQAAALEELNKSIYDIQRALNRALRMRPVPKIRFVLDKEFEAGNSLYRLLSDLDKKD